MNPQQTAPVPPVSTAQPIQLQPMPAAFSSQASCIVGKAGFPQKGTLSCNGQVLGFTSAKGQTVFSQPLSSITSISEPATKSCLYVTIGPQVYTLSTTNYFNKPAYWGGIAFLIVMLVVGLTVPNSFEYPLDWTIRFFIGLIALLVAYFVIKPALSSKSENNQLAMWRQYLKQYYRGTNSLS